MHKAQDEFDKARASKENDEDKNHDNNDHENGNISHHVQLRFFQFVASTHYTPLDPEPELPGGRRQGPYL